MREKIIACMADHEWINGFMHNMWKKMVDGDLPVEKLREYALGGFGSPDAYALKACFIAIGAG